jgi:F420H(2)-dependent biliverdin reductase
MGDQHKHALPPTAFAPPVLRAYVLGVTDLASRLRHDAICWFAAVRPDGRPHVTPIWFVFVDGRFWVCTQNGAVKVGCVIANPNVSVTLENGSAPVVAEGTATVHYGPPFAPDVAAAFTDKFDWDIERDPDGYGVLIEVEVRRWLMGA